MTPADRNAAKAALDSGSGTYGRLDQIRGPEDAAADLVDLWGAVESAMKAMLGGSSLSGQTLVRELRQRGLLSLDQANALASFWDARSRVDDVAYKPTLTDVGYARVGYNALTQAVTQPVQEAPQAAPSGGLGGPPVGGSAPFSAPGAPGSPSSAIPAQSIEMPMYESRPGVVPARESRFPFVLAGGILAGLLVVVGLVYFLFFSSSYDKQMADAVQLMRTKQTDLARAQFQQIAASNPTKAEPHVFLSRLARDGGDMATARNELITAIKLDPNSALPQREMGLLLLASNNPDLASSFLIRAVKADPNDSAASGYLGCALMKMGRVDVAQKFLGRAGVGAWTSCASPTGATR